MIANIDNRIVYNKLPAERAQEQSSSILGVVRKSLRPAPDDFVGRIHVLDIDQLELKQWDTIVKIEGLLDSSSQIPFERPAKPRSRFF